MEGGLRRPGPHPVVGQGRGAQTARADAPDRLEHPRPRDASLGDARHQGGAVDRDAECSAVGLEGRAERSDRQLAALEPRPGAAFAGGDDRAVDGVGRDTAVALIAGDRVQGRVLHDAADVEDHRRDGAHVGTIIFHSALGTRPIHR